MNCRRGILCFTVTALLFFSACGDDPAVFVPEMGNESTLRSLLEREGAAQFEEMASGETDSTEQDLEKVNQILEEFELTISVIPPESSVPAEGIDDLGEVSPTPKTTEAAVIPTPKSTEAVIAATPKATVLPTPKVTVAPTPKATVVPTPKATEPETAPVQAAVTVDLSKLPTEIVNCMNQERAAAGLPALSWNGDLASAAAIRCVETADSMVHVRPDGSEFYTVCDLAVAENLARGGLNITASEIVSLWMASGGHKENVMDSGFTVVGIAVYEHDGKVSVCALFG